MADGADAPRASREGQEQGQGQATEQSAGERPYPPNPTDSEPQPPPGPEPVPALVHEQHNEVADKKLPQEDKRQHQTEQVENEEKEEKEQPQLVRPLRSALLSASRRRARSLPEPPFDSAEPPSSQDPGARPRVSSLVNGRTPKITCLYNPGAELADLVLEPPVRSHSLEPFCIGAIAAIASARYLTWQQTRSQGGASVRMLRALVWVANLVWCGSSSAERVLRARTRNRSDSYRAAATQQQAEWSSPRRVLPKLNLDKLSQPVRDNNTATFSQQAGHFIGGAASGVVCVEVLGGYLRFSDGATGARQWAKRFGALHRVLTTLFYSTSRLLAQRHAAANWGSRSKFLHQIAVVLHLAELPHLYYRT